MKKFDLKYIPFHVLFLSLFPILSLFVHNLGQVAMWVIHRPLLISVTLGIAILLLARLVIRDWLKAGLLTSLALILFFSYGHIYNLIEDVQLFGILIGRHRYLVIVWVGLFILGAWIIQRIGVAHKELTIIMNLVGLFLIVFQVSQIAIYQIHKNLSHNEAMESVSDTFLTPKNPGEMPDIYLIILDMYGREDALEAFYEYDNRAFLEKLEEMGFYIAQCARSNYSNTALSISSQLNIDYLDVLLDDINLETTSSLLKNNTVQKSLREIGYTTIAFDTGVGWANMDQSDILYTKPPEEVILNLEPFEVMFIEGTLGRLYMDYYVSKNPSEFNIFYTPIGMKAQRIQMILNYLQLLPAMDDPIFVVAHIMIPHPPYVFNPDGSVNLQADSIKDKIGYSNQLDFLNPQVLDIVEKIIKNSSPEPIVILEGDHGFDNLQRTSILDAFYLPGDGNDALYPTISSVNTFRVIFNLYFSTDLPYLPDLSYKHIGDNLFEYEPHEEWNPACMH
jgi:hypothetical protein